jgi:hypothetical protein
MGESGWLGGRDSNPDRQIQSLVVDCLGRFRCVFKPLFTFTATRASCILRAGSASTRRNAMIREIVTKKNGEHAKNDGYRATLGRSVELN